MQCFIDENISNGDRVGRVGLGMALVIGVIITPGLPTWMAFVCAYFVLTALPARDPVYAIIGTCKRSLLPQKNGGYVSIAH